MQLRLDTFLLDPLAHSLQRSGAHVVLQPLQVELLVYLVLNRNRLVSREEIFARVWGGTIVSDGALSTAIHALRRALDDAARAPRDRWIETVRGRGYRYRGPVERIADGPLRDPIAFVGRAAVLGALLERTSRLATSRGSVALLRGPAGIGKSRLTRELARRAEGVRSITVVCEQGAPALWPWHRLLAQAAAGDSLLAPREKEDERESFRRTQSVLDRLAEGARKGPLLAIFEDLHQADVGSIALLDAVSARLDALPIAIVATQRSHEGEVAALATLATSSRVDVHEIARLDASEVWALVGEVLGRIPTPDEVARIRARSDGVPLFVIDLARCLRDGVESGPDTLPAAMAMVGRRVDGLPEATRRALTIAALAGEHFDPIVVERAAEGLLPADRSWIRDAVACGVLRPDPEQPLRFWFEHPLLREAIASRVDLLLRASLQQRIGEILEACNPDPSDRLVASLARHFAEGAVVEKDPSRALHYAMRAAQIAIESDAWSDVLAYTGRALEWLGQIERTPDHDAARLDAWMLRAAALLNFSDFDSEALPQAEAWAERVGDAETRAVVDGLWFDELRQRSRFGEASARARRIAASPGLDGIAAACACNLDLMTGRLVEALAAARSLCDTESATVRRHVARRAWNPIAEAFGSAAIAAWSLGQEHAALAFSARSIEHARDGAPFCAATMHFMACQLHDLRDDPRALLASAREIDPICARHGTSRFLGGGLVWSAYADAWLRGTPAPFAAYGAIVRERARSGRCATPTYILTVAARLFAMGDDAASAGACFDEAIEVAARTGEVFYLSEIHRRRAQWEARRGDTVAARASLERAVAQADAIGAEHLAARARRELALLSAPASVRPDPAKR